MGGAVLTFWHDALQATNFGGHGILLALALIVVLRFVVLPKDERELARGPALLLLANLVFALLRAATPAGSLGRVWLGHAALFFLLASLGRGLFLLGVHVLVSRKLDRPAPKILLDLTQGLIYGAIIFIVLHAAGANPASLLATSAVFTAVIGLSLQDTLGNLFAGLAIQAQRPFERGDWVRFGEADRADRVGQVVELNWRAVKVLTLSKEEITVPNSLLAKTPLVNFNRPGRAVRREVEVAVPFSVRPAKMRDWLEEAARSVDGVLRVPDVSAIVSDFSERGVLYRVRFYLNEYHRSELITSAVRERVWYALARQRIPIQAPMRSVELREAGADTVAERRANARGARVSALGRIDLLDALPDEAKARIADMAELRVFAPGEFVIREGDAGSELFLIEEGAVRVLADIGAGAPIEVAKLTEGEFFGEMSMLTGEQRSASVQATVDTELLAIGKDALQPVLEAAPELAVVLSDALARRHASIEARLQTESQTPGTVPPEPSRGELLDRIKAFFSLGGR